MVSGIHVVDQGINRFCKVIGCAPFQVGASPTPCNEMSGRSQMHILSFGLHDVRYEHMPAGVDQIVFFFHIGCYRRALCIKWAWVFHRRNFTKPSVHMSCCGIIFNFAMFYLS